MDTTDRLAAALRDMLTEVALTVNQNSTRTAISVRPPRPDPFVEQAEPALPERLLYPLAEVRHRLGGISRTTLYNLIGQGDLMTAKIGSRSFVTAESLRLFVDGLAAQATSNIEH